MPRHIPRNPSFANTSERLVWSTLDAQLGPNDVLIANQHLTAKGRDHELDLVVVLDGVGVAVVEVKGGQTDYRDGEWHSPHKVEGKPFNPVEQARLGSYALTGWLKTYTQFNEFHCWVHVVVLPFARVSDDSVPPDAQRWQIAGRAEMADLAGFVKKAITMRVDKPWKALSRDGRDIIVNALSRPPVPAPTRSSDAAERAAEVDRLTESQATILDVAQLLQRVHVRGGAGSGKTWLAVEQARRLTRAGKRVALMCYSRGLATWMQRQTATFDLQDRPEYVGTFLGLGVRWGAEPQGDDDPKFWEHDLPDYMFTHAADLDVAERFDAIVIDEGQDFAPAWWLAVHAALRDETAGGLYVFTDEGQQVFARFKDLPSGLVPLVLDRNLRNTRKIASTFNSLAPIQMQLGDFDGPDVRLVHSTDLTVLANADAAVQELLERGYRPSDVALLCVGKRHHEQKRRQEAGAERYWESFWDEDEVFYGHVLGFKGLERSAIVLAVNSSQPDDRAKEKLYVGLSRARDELIVCADPKLIRSIAGSAVLSQMRNNPKRHAPGE